MKTSTETPEPTAIEVERALRSVQDAGNKSECMCGVPNCPGHQMVDGEIHIPNHPKLGYVIVHNQRK